MSVFGGGGEFSFWPPLEDKGEKYHGRISKAEHRRNQAVSQRDGGDIEFVELTPENVVKYV